ncbi:MAG TPA: DUF3662 and FHA domain-containing protein [Aggregatilineales bacterium]|nr:DUF3662 and FHA domain-containing protein [Aggregatilineales bacterium]
MDSRGLSAVERRIETLVEGSFARLFSGRLQPREVAVHLARALEDNADLATDGSRIAPNHFTVRLNPEDLAAISSAQPGLGRIIGDTVIAMAADAGLRLDDTPIIKLVAESSLARRSISISASFQERNLRATQAMRPVSASPVVPEHRPRNPQLIQGSLQTFPLTRHVINIGRRHDNHIVIDDPRVSRVHVQIRLRYGHYVLYDLQSTGGTQVNGQHVKECILNPGDVISLAGVLLVYIEDEASTGHDLRNVSSTAADLDAHAESETSAKDNDPTL